MHARFCIQRLEIGAFFADFVVGDNDEEDDAFGAVGVDFHTLLRANRFRPLLVLCRSRRPLIRLCHSRSVVNDENAERSRAMRFE